jgi:hypothetical protein
MRLVTHPIAITTLLFLGLQPTVESAPVTEGSVVPQRVQRPLLSLETHPECDAAFAGLDKSGTALIAIGRWPRQRLFSNGWIEPVQYLCTLAELASHCPHRLGAIDLLSLAAPTLDDFSSLDELDGAIFGRDECCTVELWDAPSLLANLELVNRLAELQKVTVYTKRTDAQFLKALRKINASDGVKQRDPADRALKSGQVRGIVVDADGKPVAGATVMIRSRSGEPLVGSWTNDEGLFFEVNIRSVPYRIEAFAPPSWFAGSDSKVASSEPVDAKPGNEIVRLVVKPTRLVSQPPAFCNVEDDDGKRIVLDPSDMPEAAGRGR